MAQVRNKHGDGVGLAPKTSLVTSRLEIWAVSCGGAVVVGGAGKLWKTESDLRGS